jgi:formylglycine-generating enzyme required for sulfatase activity
VLAAACTVLGACATTSTSGDGRDTDVPPPPSITVDSIPGTLVSFEMVRVPDGSVRIEGAGGARIAHVKEFWIGRTELTWDAYDAFAFSAPTPATEADAVARPSRPYGAPDYGWGHRGFAAISVARPAAVAFCIWLSRRTGIRYRLPTEAEWMRAAELATGGAPLSDARRDALAWHAGNSGGRTHAVATKEADALGLHDLFGNAAEWVTNEDPRPVTRGGSFRDDASQVGPGARAVQDDSWNDRDPQIPKSVWWLSDGPFVGFRIVREP